MLGQPNKSKFLKIYVLTIYCSVVPTYTNNHSLKNYKCKLTTLCLNEFYLRMFCFTLGKALSYTYNIKTPESFEINLVFCPFGIRMVLSIRLVLLVLPDRVYVCSHVFAYNQYYYNTLLQYIFML